jgi:hypothetical protein
MKPPPHPHAHENPETEANIQRISQASIAALQVRNAPRMAQIADLTKHIKQILDKHRKAQNE